MAGARRPSGSGQPSRRRASDADFRRLVDELKDRINFSDVAATRIKLHRVGHEFEALCPFHSERTPSFTINDAKGFGHCFGCGWHGDVLAFVMALLKCEFREAYQRVANADLPIVPPQAREKARAVDRLVDLGKEDEARRQWKGASPIEGTPAQTYLRARGITYSPPDTAARFGVVPVWVDLETKRKGPERPALICGAADATGAIVGVQRIFFLNDDPTLGRADKPKRSLGTIKGSVMRLAPAAETVILPEAPEDGFSIAQERPDHPVWVPFGTSMMPAVPFPEIVRHVIIAGQNNTASRRAVEKSAIALIDSGLEVTRAWPAREYDDWNDQLRGARA